MTTLLWIEIILALMELNLDVTVTRAPIVGRRNRGWNR